MATEYFPVDSSTKPFDDDMNNLAPSLGIAWSPQFKNSILKGLFGEGEQTVLRAAYSISYVTGGFADFNGVWNSNPGLAATAGARAGIEFTAGSLLLRDNPNLLRPLPTRTFPLLGSPGIAAWDFDPNLRAPYVQSWSFGIQRELNRDTVFEARYVGNHSIGLGIQHNLNEVNIFENGFLQEFIAAQRNLEIALAAGRAANFRNQGLPGQVNLPIFTASFGSPTAANFGNATFIQLLQQGQAGNLANQLGNSTANLAFQTNRIAAGLSPNFFIVNPTLLGAKPCLRPTAAGSTYNALQVELRRRFANGLLVQGNYTWSHALTNLFTASGCADSPATHAAQPRDGQIAFAVRHSPCVQGQLDLRIANRPRTQVRLHGRQLRSRQDIRRLGGGRDHPVAERSRLRAHERSLHGQPVRFRSGACRHERGAVARPGTDSQAA